MAVTADLPIVHTDSSKKYCDASCACRTLEDGGLLVVGPLPRLREQEGVCGNPFHGFGLGQPDDLAAFL
jgi:hypothetical protein